MNMESMIRNALEDAYQDKISQILNSIPEYIRNQDTVMFKQEYDSEQCTHTRRTTQEIWKAILKTELSKQDQVEIATSIFNKIRIMGPAGADAANWLTNFVYKMNL